MYSSTVIRFEWLTEKAPYADCQPKAEEQFSLSFAHVEVSVLIFSTSFAMVMKRPTLLCGKDQMEPD